MIITQETTVKNILDTYPGAVAIFENHGVNVPVECDECILDSELSVCDSMCHIDDLDALMRDLQEFVTNQGD
ncbi:MAG: hypothetical protein QG625_2803 [Cyanobacteriota bacterium erpe_2018_sw_39hr_WHONDRS-SW48-000098_B_bin.30]|nr:hypothetical protein [Cyanobacteriota bacterium erpe_2018_sw_39hr_WHONDRS-SW48-000098_B_bin.30]